MTKLQNLTLSVIILSLLFFTSCENKNDQFEKQKELELIDSLSLTLSKTRLLLDINYPEIKERIAPMEKNMRILQNDFKQEWTEEVTINIERYRGYLKIYKKFITHYKKVVLETEELFTQVKTLKSAVKKGKYTGKKEDFKKHYQQEKKDVTNNYLFAKRYLKPVKIMERDYQRRAEYVEDLVGRIKK